MTRNPFVPCFFYILLVFVKRSLIKKIAHTSQLGLCVCAFWLELGSIGENNQLRSSVITKTEVLGTCRGYFKNRSQATLIFFVHFIFD